MAYPVGALPLPFELNREIALSLPLADLLSFCSTSKILARMCRLGKFWRDKYYRDYPDLPFEQNLLQQGETYYTVNGIDYRALYLVSHLLYPGIERGRQLLEEMLALNPDRKPSVVYFLGPTFPLFLQKNKISKDNPLTPDANLEIRSPYPETYDQNTVSWRLNLTRPKTLLYPANIIDTGHIFFLIAEQSSETVAGIGGMHEAVNTLLGRGYVPFDPEYSISQDDLLKNYNYFVFNRSKMSPWVLASHGRATHSLPSTLRMPGQKSPKMVQDGLRLASPDELRAFLAEPTQLLEYSRQDLSLWRELIKRDFPLHLSQGSINDYLLYDLFAKLQLDKQVRLQNFIAKFRGLLTRTALPPYEEAGSFWLIRASLPLRIHSDRNRFYYLTDGVKLEYLIRRSPDAYQYRIMVERDGDKTQDNFPFLPENDPKELLEWLDDLEKDYLCFVPFVIKPENIVSVPHLISDKPLPVMVKGQLEWPSARRRRK